MNDILPDGLEIIPYHVTQTEERLDEWWKGVLTEIAGKFAQQIDSSICMQFSEEEQKP